MTRRLQPSHERIMFPAWSATSEDLNDGPILSRRRRRQCKLWTRRAILLISVLTVIWLVRPNRSGSDMMLNKVLSKSEFKELGIAPFQRPYLRSDNPWRGAGRRAGRNIIMSVSGCGGSFRRAIAVGDKANVRYSIRSADGTLYDTSKGSADVLVGSGQVDEEIDHSLQGLCAEEAVRFHTRDGRRVLLYVERVGSELKNGKALEDRLATMVTTMSGRKGRSCRSTCRGAGLVCEGIGFILVNNCPRLREAFGCLKCEVAAAGSSGADMPAFVVKSAPIGHARGGCLVTPHAVDSKCEAKYAYTRRLCPCFEDGAVEQAMGEIGKRATRT